MRTTVDLPDLLFRQMKATATLRGISMKELITTAIETEIFKGQSSNDYSIQLPLIHSKHPGTLDLTNTEIEDLLT